MEKREYGRAADLARLERLAQGFGPTGCEDEIRRIITEQIRPLADEYRVDRLGNLIAKMSFGDAPRKKLMISAHMDEVGFMITELCEDGYLRFDTVGGIDPSVLAGRKVVLGDENKRVRGIIASKAIHHKSQDERKKAVAVEKLVIDVGTSSREESEALLSIGDFGTFDSELYCFGQDGRMIKGKALDDRMGCAAMIEVMEDLRRKPTQNAVEVYFCFTVREEIGLSGAKTAANAIAPDFALVLETTAVGDIADTAPAKRVASVGKGGAVSLMDRSTIYHKPFVDFLMRTAEENGIPAQIKQYVSGGNDGGSIHKTGRGVRTAALSVPTRYLHSAACVASLTDYEAVRDLCEATIRNFDLEVEG